MDIYECENNSQMDDATMTMFSSHSKKQQQQQQQPQSMVVSECECCPPLGSGSGFWNTPMLEIMKKQDIVCMPSPNYIVAKQYEYGLSPNERESVVAWIFSSVEDLTLRNETASAATNLFDRTLSAISNVPKNRLQLVAAACLVIASKMIEVNCALPAEVCYHAGRSFPPEEVKAAELTILQTLNWSVNCVTVHTFLHSFLTIPHFAKLGEAFHSVADLFADMSCVENSLMQFRPSVVAAAAILCALDIFGMPLESSVKVLVDLRLVDCDLSQIECVRFILSQVYIRAQQLQMQGYDDQPANAHNNNNNNNNNHGAETPRTALGTFSAAITGLSFD